VLEGFKLGDRLFGRLLTADEGSGLTDRNSFRAGLRSNRKMPVPRSTSNFTDFN
jgi:hypothetical protein